MAVAKEIDRMVSRFWFANGELRELFDESFGRKETETR